MKRFKEFKNKELEEGKITKEQFKEIPSLIDKAVKEFESSVNSAMKTLGSDSLQREAVKRHMSDALIEQLDKARKTRGGTFSISSAKVKKNVADKLKGAVIKEERESLTEAGTYRFTGKSQSNPKAEIFVSDGIGKDPGKISLIMSSLNYDVSSKNVPEDRDGMNKLAEKIGKEVERELNKSFSNVEKILLKHK